MLSSADGPVESAGAIAAELLAETDGH